ncbi:MAG: hypothetical protein AAGI44_16635 [Pseudomonadota bacterium]
MSIFNRLLVIILFFLFLGIFAVSSTHAHLIEAQHGTLNIVDDGAFMVLSLPVSAFDNLDGNSDGKVSFKEFNMRHAYIEDVVKSQVLLHDAHGLRQLEGTIVTAVVGHDKKEDVIDQITVLGRFKLRTPDSPLNFIVGLFGEAEPEKKFMISAQRQVDGRSVSFILKPDASSRVLFPPL